MIKVVLSVLVAATLSFKCALADWHDDAALNHAYNSATTQIDALRAFLAANTDMSSFITDGGRKLDGSLGASVCGLGESSTTTCCNAGAEIQAAFNSCPDPQVQAAVTELVILNNPYLRSTTNITLTLQKLCASSCWANIAAIAAKYQAMPASDKGCAAAQLVLPKISLVCSTDSSGNYCLNTFFQLQGQIGNWSSLARTATTDTLNLICGSTCVAQVMTAYNKALVKVVAATPNAQRGVAAIVNLEFKLAFRALNLICSKDPADGIYCLVKVRNYLQSQGVISRLLLRGGSVDGQPQQRLLTGNDFSGGPDWLDVKTQANTNISIWHDPEMACSTCGRAFIVAYLDITSYVVGILELSVYESITLHRRLSGGTGADAVEAAILSSAPDMASAHARLLTSSASIAANLNGADDDLSQLPVGLINALYMRILRFYKWILTRGCGVANGKVCLRLWLEVSDAVAGTHLSVNYPSGVAAADPGLNATIHNLAVCGAMFDSTSSANTCPAGCAAALNDFNAKLGCCGRGFVEMLGVARAMQLISGSVSVTGNSAWLTFAAAADADVVFNHIASVCGVTIPTCAAQQTHTVRLRFANLLYAYWSSSAVIDNFKAALIQDLAAAANVDASVFAVSSVQSGSVIVTATVSASTDDSSSAIASQVSASVDAGTFNAAAVAELAGAASSSSMADPNGGVGATNYSGAASLALSGSALTLLLATVLAQLRFA